MNQQVCLKGALVCLVAWAAVAQAQPARSIGSPGFQEPSDAAYPFSVQPASFEESLAMHESADCDCCASAECACSDCSHCCANHCRCGRCLHRTGAFGEFLYIRPRNVDLYYAVPQDGIGGIGTVPVGRAGVLNYEYDAGFRVGGVLALDCCSSITATYTWYQTEINDNIQIDAPDVIQPLVMYPGTFNAGFTAQQAAANNALEFQFVDVDFKAIWCQGHTWHVNYLLGARYGNLDQQFSATFPFAPPDGQTSVFTDVEFDGGGIRLGLEGERCLHSGSGLSVYGKSTLSILGGQFRGHYQQVNQLRGTEALLLSQENRVVPILETEVGIGWTSASGRLRWTAGYMFNWWANVVTVPEYINSVQAGNFVDISQDAYDTLSFDGLTSRVELSF